MVALTYFLTDLHACKWKMSADFEKKRRKYWICAGIVLALLPLGGAMLPDSGFKFAIQAAGNVWLGFFIYYGGLILIFSIIGLLIRFIIRSEKLREWHGVVLCASAVIAFAVMVYGLIHAQNTRVVTYDLELDKPAGEMDEMKVVLLGDLHLSVNSYLKTTQRMVELVNEQNPDGVVIAGDIYTSSYRGLANPEALRQIRSEYGVYAVYGNHDVEEMLFGGCPISPISKAFRTREMEQFFDDCGFITLADETVTLNGAVQLAGRIDGVKAGDGTTNRMSAQELLKDTDRDLPILVLQHEPIDFHALKEAGADIAMCGHTHAGQMFPGDLIVPLFNENGWGYKIIEGLYTYVTAGVGYYGPPMRVGTDSEVTVINLKFNSDGADN